MRVDAKEVLSRLKKSERIRRSMYVSEVIYEEFQKACGEVGVSPVLEELMKQFVESVKEKKPTSK